MILFLFCAEGVLEGRMPNDAVVGMPVMIVGLCC